MVFSFVRIASMWARFNPMCDSSIEEVALRSSIVAGPKQLSGSGARQPYVDSCFRRRCRTCGGEGVAGWGLVRTHAAGAACVLPRPSTPARSALRFSRGERHRTRTARSAPKASRRPETGGAHDAVR